ncbi:MAG: hypothetical protein QOJ23_2720 [Actinomycetota bacterium]|jgi:streptogramin lyase|nr:hypothetical protein [Actinomycetota bacterium]
MARRCRPLRLAALFAAAALAAALGATVVTTNSWAAAGILDPTFGSAGTVNTAGQADARAVVLQPDGKLVAAGLGKGRAITRGKPISGMVPGQSGYMMVAQDGGIFSFGNVAFHGSLGSNPPPKPASVALQP